VDGWVHLDLPCGDDPPPYDARTSVSKALLVPNPTVAASKMGVSPNRLGTVTAEQCFREANLDSDGQTSEHA
jgi:hypothetical protein